MNYVLIGGDARMQSLYRRLKRDGESVFCYAMETAPLPDGAKCTELPKNADVYVLPLPSEKRRGHINAPFCPSPPETARLFAELPQGALVCGGKVSAEMRETAEMFGIRLYDCMLLPDFVVGNAAITAEAAVSLLMEATPDCIAGKRILVLGRGRIGKLLGDKLRALGAEVWVMSGNPEAAALAQALGFGVLPKGGGTSGFCMAVNTAPAMTLSPSQQREFDAGCVLLELASAPGFDPDETAHCRLINAPGLPGKYAPDACGELLRNAVNLIVKEHMQ